MLNGIGGLRLSGTALCFFLSSATVAIANDVCRTLVCAQAGYTACTFDLRRYDLRLFWKTPAGQAYGSISALVGSPEGASLVFAMNAGMYHEDLSPVGLHVENGRVL